MFHLKLSLTRGDTAEQSETTALTTCYVATVREVTPFSDLRQRGPAAARGWRRSSASGAVRLVVASTVLGLVTSGCMTPTSNTNDDDPPATQLTLLVPDWTSDYWDTLRTAAIDQGSDLSVDVLADAGDDKTDSASQIRRITAIASEKQDCFAIAPVDPVRLVQPLVAIAEQGVPILNVGTRLDEAAAKKAGVPIASFIGPQDQEIGHIAARKMLTVVPAGSQVAMVTGTSSDPNAAEQRVGFTEAVGTGLTVLTSKATDDDYARAVNVVTDLLSALPGIKGIFASSDMIGRAAAKAVESQGLAGKVTIISVGGSVEGLRAVQSGELTATVATYPAAGGEWLVRACRKLVDGGTVQPRLIVPARLVDATTVQAAIGAYPDPVERFADPLS